MCVAMWPLLTVSIDIDECELDTDGCHQQCINTPGSFMCNCSDGYLLNEDGFTCDGNTELS